MSKQHEWSFHPVNPRKDTIMKHTTRSLLFLAGALVCAAASAVQFDGKLPMYPHGHNMNDMPASAIAMGVPMVLETTDAVHLVDLWYASNAKACTRSAASGGVKYQCPTGSIMIYPHGSKTQIALGPAMAMLGH